MKKLLLLIMLMSTSVFAGQEYDTSAKKYPNQNDVKALVYQWFAKLDHQADVYWFLSHIAEDFYIQYANSVLTDEEKFVNWYNTEEIGKIYWSANKVESIKLNIKGTASNPYKYIVEVVITREYMTYDAGSPKMVSKVYQNWTITPTDKNGLQIEKISTKLLDAPKKLNS